jgi:hypothetical protein
MKTFEAPNAEVILFDVKDVLTASGEPEPGNDSPEDLSGVTALVELNKQDV